ncbi:MAG: sterol desaturase family protein [Paracoccaceae bacterium]|nr:sterol desaturase family protein [Paracoccaceae bacterium]
MIAIWLVSIVPQTLVAGTPHWWRYIRKGQGSRTKFDRRDLMRSNGIFTFRNQVWGNIWRTLGSAITVATIYRCLVFWAMTNGYAPSFAADNAPVFIVVWTLLNPMWSSPRFYWARRLAHHPKLHKHVHAVHHRNVIIEPRSGISGQWYENLLYFSTDFIHLMVMSNPLHVLFHAHFQQISPLFSHAGLEKSLVKETQSARSGDSIRQLHHRYFECNYGTSEIPFDRWFGTYHDISVAATERTRARKKQMYTRCRPALAGAPLHPLVMRFHELGMLVAAPAEVIDAFHVAPLPVVGRGEPNHPQGRIAIRPKWAAACPQDRQPMRRGAAQSNLGVSFSKRDDLGTCC